ncbi:MAG: OmpA family protein [Bdellovibrionaceae bacterium]|nr:OmpA family protein [Pseudobdellovibrionaceae bacterium]
MKDRRWKKRDQEHEEVDSEGSWAVSYGDMVTLLLSFFIIFFTTDPKQGTKQRVELKVSLVETLKNKSSHNSETGNTEIVNAGNNKEEGIDRKILKDWNGVAHEKGNHIIIEFPYTSFFKSAQTDLTKEGRKALFDFVKVYMPYAGNYNIGIRAYADKRRVLNKKRKFSDNLELSALRSIATMRVLQEAGIPLNRIRTGGYGELILTANELMEIPAEKRVPASEYEFARKIVLVIEPDTTEI